MTLKAIIHEAEEGGFWAEVPAFPGCFTQAESIAEIEANLLEAIKGWLLAAEPEGGVPGGLRRARRGGDCGLRTRVVGKIERRRSDAAGRGGIDRVAAHA